MTQLSRPFQIVLVAFGLFVAVWFVALHGHNSSSTGGSGSSASGSSAPASSAASSASSQPGSSASQPGSSAAAQAKAAAAPTHVYHGAAPGVEGLTRAVNRAHGAVAQSQADARRFEHADPSGATTSSTVTVQRSTASGAHHTTTVRTTTVTRPKTAPARAKSTSATPSMQAAVEHELSQGQTVLILFWNPHGSDDVAVHRELAAVQRSLGRRVAVHDASASQVGAFGTVTHNVQVTQTPTLLIVNPHGQTTVVTGLADAFSIKQAVAEAHRS